MIDIRRGQMWMCKVPVSTNSSIQAGTRPFIIVSNNVLNMKSPVLLGVPCTTQVKRNFPTHMLFIVDGVASVALAEQVRPIEKSDLLSFMQIVDDYLMDQLDVALQVALGMKDTNYSRVIEEERG